MLLYRNTKSAQIYNNFLIYANFFVFLFPVQSFFATKTAPHSAELLETLGP